MGRAWYFIREALRGLLEAKLMTGVSVVTVTVTLFVLALAFVGYRSAVSWLTQLSDRADMLAYVSEQAGADGAKLHSLAGRVREYPQVDSVAVVDKDMAWERFRQMYGSDMLHMVDENPLPASLEIGLREHYRTRESLELMQRELEGLEGVESVDFSSVQASQIGRLNRWVMIGTALLGLLGILVLYYVVANTVKLTIYARRELVVNMQFVGATKAFIATPFVLEGMLQGLLGGGLAACAVAVVRLLAHGNPMIVWEQPAPFTLAIMAIGVVSACVGSIVAVWKFLV